MSMPWFLKIRPVLVTYFITYFTQYYFQITTIGHTFLINSIKCTNLMRAFRKIIDMLLNLSKPPCY